jgi:hypothetical protein
MRRIMLAAAVLAIPLSAATVGIVATASSAGASSPVTCAKVTGSLSGTVHFDGCTTPYGSGNAVGTGLATGGTLSWGGTGKLAGSVSFSGSVTTPGQGSCAAGSTEYVASDVVTAATGTAVGHAKVGESVKADACRTATGHLAVISGSITP